jgi:hypothetical protein
MAVANVGRVREYQRRMFCDLVHCSLFDVVAFERKRERKKRREASCSGGYNTVFILERR